MSINYFIAQLGSPHNSGLLSQEERLTQFQAGQNPYVCNAALVGNSPVFYGREHELQTALSLLCRVDKPQNLNIIGEQRIGKTSFLNQIYQGLAKEINLISIYTNAQDWRPDYTKDNLLNDLRKTICDVTDSKPEPISGYSMFSQFILQQAQTYRFVLLIDEFERMSRNPHFDAEFFRQMRSLGEDSQYRFSYLLVSRNPIQEICYQYDLQSSEFWSIFRDKQVIGLLDKEEAEHLISEPMRCSLGVSSHNVQETITTKVKEILRYTGYHPAFIQVTAKEYWQALQGKFDVNLAVIKESLRGYYRELWESCTALEKELLLHIASQEHLVLENLVARGLTDSKNRLFSPLFAQMVKTEFAMQLGFEKIKRKREWLRSSLTKRTFIKK